MTYVNFKHNASSRAGSSLLRIVAPLAVYCAIFTVPGTSFAGACTGTANAAITACQHEVKSDFWIAKGNCRNLKSDPVKKTECIDDAKEDRDEELELCDDQLQARLDLCGDIGEGTYNPKFQAANFVNPLKIGKSVTPNPYIPLVPGNKWVYEEEDATVTVTVREETKLINGVKCIVVRDVEKEDGVKTEKTDDWFAQDIFGNVWYCGEISKEFVVPKGEDEPELIGTEGSWKAYRDKARPGIIMHALPQVGKVFRQEFALGDAEDVGKILSTTASESVPVASCVNNCVQTEDYTPLEPGALEHKYYAPGVGLILEVDLESGDRVELVKFRKGQ